MRRSPAAVGGTVKDHFDEFVGSSWRVLLFPNTEVPQRRDNAAPRFLRTPASMARRAGVAALGIPAIREHWVHELETAIDADADPLVAAAGKQVEAEAVGGGGAGQSTADIAYQNVMDLASSRAGSVGRFSTLRASSLS